MKNKLLVSLIEKSIVQEGTEIVIFRTGTSMNGNIRDFKVEQHVEVIGSEIKNGIALLQTESRDAFVLPCRGDR